MHPNCLLINGEIAAVLAALRSTSRWSGQGSYGGVCEERWMVGLKWQNNALSRAWMYVYNCKIKGKKRDANDQIVGSWNYALRV